MNVQTRQRQKNTYVTTLILSILMLWLSGCTVLLPFSKCETTEECPSGATCEDGLCRTPGDDLPIELVNSNISTDTTWTPDRVYVLTEIISVLPSTTLTIKPGTIIKGERGTALVAREGAILDAVGTREAPIVFTSAKPPGTRLAGDWGGLAMLGKAPVNRENAYLNIYTNVTDARFGGSDPKWNCGSLKYVRIEFAGGQVAGEEALNGLTVAGCGSDTLVDYVQIHFGADDGFEIFGGTVDVKHILITRAQDDGLDIDLGWVGKAQYVAILQDAAGDNGIEIDNLKEKPLATPLTDFKIYNYTIVAFPDRGQHRGITFKAGAAGELSHGIIMGQSMEAIDVFGVEAGQRGLAGEINVHNTLFYKIGEGGTRYFPKAGDEGETGAMGEPDDDAGFAENEHFVKPEFMNVFGKDPKIRDPSNVNNPTWVPSAEHTTGQDISPPPEGFDPTAVYLGAFSPTADPWTEDWTAYPDS